jgi:hypothetical protein
VLRKGLISALECRHGYCSLAHRAGVAIADSVTMWPFLSRAFVKKSHIVTFARSTFACAGQWQRLGTALAKYHAFKACASQMSISALWRRHDRYAVGFVQQRDHAPHCKSCLCCRVAHRHLSCVEVLLVWSVAKAEYRHCQSIWPRLAIASCW